MALARVGGQAADFEHVAGGSRCDGLAATDAVVVPNDITVDGAGNVYVTDVPHVRRIDAVTGVITTVAGPGGPGPAGAVSLAADAAGRVVIGAHDGVFRWDAASGVVERLTGSPETCRDGDALPAAVACMSAVYDVAITRDGTIFVADGFGVRRIDPASGMLTLETPGLGLTGPSSLAVDSEGRLFVAHGARVLRLDRTTGSVTRYAGSDDPRACRGTHGDGGPAAAACILPVGLAVDALGNLIFSDLQTGTTRVVDAGSGTIRRAAAPAGSALAVDWAGNVYVAANTDVTRTDAETGATTRIAGNGSRTACGDGLAAASAGVAAWGLAFDAQGNLLVAGEGRIRRVEAETGIITTIAGSDALHCAEPSDEPEIACHACLADVWSLAVGPGGDVFFAQGYGPDGLHQRVRRISAETGSVTTVAGRGHREWADGLPVLDSGLTGPVSFDGSGHLYLSEWGNGIVRVDTMTAAGTRVTSQGSLIGVDAAGRLYVYDEGRVFRLDAESASPRLVAGDGRAAGFDCHANDGTPAPHACLGWPVAVDAGGNLLLFELGLVRRVAAVSGRLETIALTCAYGAADCAVVAMALGPEGRLAFSEPDRVLALGAVAGEGRVLPDSDVMAHAACGSLSSRECVHDEDCADGDSCTDDACRDGACVRERVTGLGGARCAVRELRAVSECVPRQSARELRLLATARTLSRFLELPRRGASRSRRLARLELATGRLIRRVLDATDTGEVSLDCEERLLSRLWRLRRLVHDLER